MIDTLIIPQKRQVIYDTYANFPTTGLEKGDLGWATDRKCLYRWSGSAWVSIGISSRHGDYADIGDPANYPESSFYQADDQGKLYMIMSGAWEAIIVPAAAITPIVSDDLKNSNDTERTTLETSYTKVKEVKINEAYAGDMRIKFDLKSSGANYVYGRIYKNGSPIGTAQNTGSTSYQTFSEDLALSLVADDLLQVYAYRINTTCYVRNFRFYYRGQIIEIAGETLITDIFVEKTTISVTNQDP